MTPRSRHRAFGVLKHMSKRELRALVGAEDPASPSLEPEAEGETEGSEEGHAEAARLARVIQHCDLDTLPVGSQGGYWILTFTVRLYTGYPTQNSAGARRQLVVHAFFKPRSRTRVRWKS